MKLKNRNVWKKRLCFLLACMLLLALPGCGLRNEANSAPTEQPAAGSDAAAAGQKGEERQLLIAIDPGHQAEKNAETEPNGPGSSTVKAKVSSGTKGAFTGVNEYELNLVISLKLRDELESRGYSVLMTRTTNDVNISNIERTEMANNAGADALLHIHANWSDDASVHGILALCVEEGNPYNPDLAGASKKLSKCILESLSAETGAYNRGARKNTGMTGLNWSKVPVTTIEIGFMTNEEEDRAMQTEAYQDKIVKGIANGLDAFFKDR